MNEERRRKPRGEILKRSMSARFIRQTRSKITKERIESPKQAFPLSTGSDIVGCSEGGMNNVSMSIADKILAGKKKALNQEKVALPKQATNILKEWFLANIDNPYPNYAAKEELCSQTGLTKKQVQTWFTNSRKVDPNRSFRCV